MLVSRGVSKVFRLRTHGDLTVVLSVLVVMDGKRAYVGSCQSSSELLGESLGVGVLLLSGRSGNLLERNGLERFGAGAHESEKGSG